MHMITINIFLNFVWPMVTHYCLPDLATQYHGLTDQWYRLHNCNTCHLTGILLNQYLSYSNRAARYWKNKNQGDRLFVRENNADRFNEYNVIVEHAYLPQP